MAYTPVSYVDVSLWDQWVGRLAQDPSTGFYSFAYHPDWVSGGVEIAPMHMPLRVEPYQFTDLDPATFLRLPPVIADALPDRFGNALVDAWMAEQGIGASSVSPLDRLAYASNRCMGALEFAPPASLGPAEASIVQVADLVLAARETVHGDVSREGVSDAMAQLIQVGTSAGGARAKAVVAYNRETSQIRSGHAPHRPGFEQYLLKLDGVSDFGLDGRVDALGSAAPYGRIEYAYYLMARAAGVTMQDSELLLEGPRAHFLTKRFDRGVDGQRHHVITLCALGHHDFNQPASTSYDQYLDAITWLGLGPSDLAQGFRRMVFNFAACNRDDHTKNLAFRRQQYKGWELTPAYDVTYAFNPEGQWTRTHQMRINGKVEGITLADLHAVGDRHDVPGYRQIVREVLGVVGHWPDFARQAGVPEATTASIRAAHAQ